MQASGKIQPGPLLLTDYSFVEYFPITDLMQQLLSSSEEHQHEPISAEIQEEKRPCNELALEQQRVELSETQSMRLKTEVNTVKICSCKKSKCSKNYCQCHRAGRKCSDECGCLNCSNIIDDPHKPAKNEGIKSGCNCKMSYCLKKYCQCHHNGNKCGSSCKCLNCKNNEDDQTQKKGDLFAVIDAI